jgi:hypothetical protein
LLGERGYMIMKKIVSIVLTTGLLMGTVAFSALACDRGNGPDQFQDQKRMGQHERYQPPMGPRDHREKMVLRGEVNRPGPASAPMVRKPAPDPGRDHRLMPQPGPERRDHDRQPGLDRPGLR